MLGFLLATNLISWLFKASDFRATPNEWTRFEDRNFQFDYGWGQDLTSKLGLVKPSLHIRFYEIS